MVKNYITLLFSMYTILLSFNGSAQESIKETPKGRGYTSELHKKYVNKIVFSNQEILQDFKEEILAEKWNLGSEPIHFRVFFDNPFHYYYKNIPGSKKKYEALRASLKIKVFIDSSLVETRLDRSWQGYDREEKRMMWTTYRNKIDPMNRKKDSHFGLLLMDAFRKHDINVGVYNVRFEVRAFDELLNKESELMASGLLQVEISQKTYNSLLEGNMCLPKAKIRNNKLENEMLAAIEREELNDIEQSVSIINNSWENIYNRLSGVLMYRQIKAAVSFKSDSKCYYRFITFGQSFEGNKFNKIVYVNEYGDRRDIPCSCFVK